MINSDDIVKTVRSIVNESETRARPKIPLEFKAPFELETKININSLEIVEDVIERVKLLGVLGYEKRSEIHYLFSDLESNSGCLISVVDKNTKFWAKIKNNSTVIESPKFKIPFVSRSGKKFSEKSETYDAAVKSIIQMNFIDSFSKSCINTFFRFQNSIYSLSFSLAENNRGFIHQQMEFEYEGKLNQSKNDEIEDLLIEFEELFKLHFPHFIDKFVSTTKEQELVNKNIYGKA